jgi:uncharacterized protein YecE (DUF72 family)
LPARLYLGTSSWSFPGWHGLVYGGRHTKTQLSRRGLVAYARHPLLRTVGIDSTYYGMVSARRLADWAAQVPGDFRFLMKAPQELLAPWTREAGIDNPRYLDSGWAADHVVRPFVEGLGAKGGILLFQFPPQGRGIATEPRRFAERLYRFLDTLPKGIRYAVELRDASLYGSELLSALRHGGGLATLSVHPRAAPPAVQERLYDDRPGGTLVLRWMLRRDRGYEEARDDFAPFNRLLAQDPASRDILAGACRKALAAGDDVFVIVNNKAEGCSPLSLAALAEAIVGAGGHPGF